MRVLLLLLLLLQPGRVLAHAALVEASPEDGASVEVSPEVVRLRFDEAVGLIALGLVGPQGAVAPVGAAMVADDVVTARFPPGLPRGTYLLSWRVTSADSHPVAGTIAFGVGVAAAGRGGAAVEWWLAPSMAIRAVFLAVLLVAAGGALFRVVAEPPWRAALAGVAWAGVALAGLQVGLRGALLADAPTLWAAGPWVLGLGTTLAASLAVSAVGLAGCALTLRPGRDAQWGVVAAGVAMGGLALSGHAGTAAPRWLMAPALVLHGLAAAFWIGALFPLLGLLRGDGMGAVRRFSAAAVPAVGLLVVSGAVLAAVQLGGVAGLGSWYGGVLLLKLGGVAGLLVLAGLNKWGLMGEPDRKGGLRARIWGELVLASGVLCATAVLGLTPPPRGEVAPLRAERAVWATADGIEATIAVGPGRVGRNRFSVTIGRAMPPRAVMLELRHGDFGVAGVRRAMVLADGVWTYEGPELALPGRWTIRAEALLTEFELTNFMVEMDIK